MIEIEFPNDTAILAALRDLLKHFGTEHPRRSDEQVIAVGANGNRRRFDSFDKRLSDERQRLLSKLLHAMAKKLGFKIEQLEIFEGGYIPQGWEDELVEQQLVRRFLLDLYAGRVALPVMAVEPPSSSTPPGSIGQHGSVQQFGDGKRQ